MKENILEIIVCPHCKSELNLILGGEFSCSICNRRYFAKGRVFYFLEKESKIEIIQSRDDLKKRIIRGLREIYLKIKPSSTFKSKKNKNRIFNLVETLGADEISINIGSGRTSYHSRLLNIDIEENSNVHIIADARALPIKSNSISLVVSQAVLEHTPDTKTNIDEITRVLTKNGMLYIEVPFMQTYHAHPHDYFRFTHNGIKSFLHDYDVIEEGIAVGPASATALNLRIFFATLFSGGNKNLFIIFTLIFSWITHPIKYLDYFLEGNPLSFYGASGIYVIARKKD